MKSLKKIISILFVTIMMLCLCLPVYAADSNVRYVGGAEKFVFEPGSKYAPTTDLFDNFKNVMPGDSITEQILVKNEVKNKVKIRLYMRSLGAQENTDEFLSQLSLSVKQNGSSVLFEAPANETAQLTDWVYLGTIYSGGEITLDVTLDVPLDMGNEFQDAVGYIDWEFKVEELPVSPDDPEIPGTGDDTLAYLKTVLLISGIAVVFITAAEKKKKRA